MGDETTTGDAPGFTTGDAREAMLEAIARAEAAGIDDETLDRMRLGCEFFTNPRFATAMADRAWEARV